MAWIRYSLVLLLLAGNACFVHFGSSASVERQASDFVPNSASDDVTFDVPLSNLEITVPLPAFIANEVETLPFVSPTPSITPTTSPSVTPSASPTPSSSAQPSKPAASLSSPTPSSSLGTTPTQSPSVLPAASSSPQGPNEPAPAPDPGTPAASTSPKPSPSVSPTPLPSSSPTPSPLPQQDPSKLLSLTRRRNQRRRRSNSRDNGTFAVPDCGCLPADGVPDVGTTSAIDAVSADLPAALPTNNVQRQQRLDTRERVLDRRETELVAIASELGRLGSEFGSIETSLEAALQVAAQAGENADDSEAELIAQEEAISDPSDLYEPRTSQIARQIRRSIREEDVILASKGDLESAIAEREAQIAALETAIAEDDDAIQNLLDTEEAVRQRETDASASNTQRRRRRRNRLNFMLDRLYVTTGRLLKTLEILTLRKATVEDNLGKLELLAKLKEVREDRIEARADYVWALGGPEP